MTAVASAFHLVLVNDLWCIYLNCHRHIIIQFLEVFIQLHKKAKIFNFSCFIKSPDISGVYKIYSIGWEGQVHLFTVVMWILGAVATGPNGLQIQGFRLEFSDRSSLEMSKTLTITEKFQFDLSLISISVKG